VSDILSHLQLGFGVAFSWSNLAVALIGAFLGTMVGVLPGLGPINGVAMLIPIAFAMNLPPETALILLAAVYVGAEYGGRITAILINVPGEASAIMTTLRLTAGAPGGANWRFRCRPCRLSGDVRFGVGIECWRRCWKVGNAFALSKILALMIFASAA